MLRVGGFEEAFPGLYDNQVFYAKVCLTEPVFASSQCTARYRQHEGVLLRQSSYDTFRPKRARAISAVAQYLTQELYVNSGISQKSFRIAALPAVKAPKLSVHRLFASKLEWYLRPVSPASFYLPFNIDRDKQFLQDAPQQRRVSCSRVSNGVGRIGIPDCPVTKTSFL